MLYNLKTQKDICIIIGLIILFLIIIYYLFFHNKFKYNIIENFEDPIGCYISGGQLFNTYNDARRLSGNSVDIYPLKSTICEYMKQLPYDKRRLELLDLMDIYN